VKILGIDPGATIGLCVYDTEAKRAVFAAQHTDPMEAVHHVRHLITVWWPKGIGIERARIYGTGGNEVANTIEQVGFILGKLAERLPDNSGSICECGGGYYTVTRQAVVSALSVAVGQSVKGDAGVWQALCTLHPGGGQRPVAAKPATRQKPAVDAVEAGPLFGVSSHARAALAVAWTLGKHLEAR
jgi:hypothetical protein